MPDVYNTIACFLLRQGQTASRTVGNIFCPKGCVSIISLLFANWDVVKSRDIIETVFHR